MSAFEAFMLIIFAPAVWVLISGLIMLHIRLTAKKKWHKNEKLYPYFHYPFYKKIFLLGLNGAIDIFVVIATFIGNIATAIMIGTSIWLLISYNIYVDYVLRAICGIELIAFLTKLGVYGFSPCEF